MSMLLPCSPCNDYMAFASDVMPAFPKSQGVHSDEYFHVQNFLPLQFAHRQGHILLNFNRPVP